MAIVTAGAGPALAWDRVQQYVRGTAETLEKGQLTVGVLAPVSYGISDALTISSHPIFDLLLLPNVDLRYRVWSDERWVAAAFAGYAQGFLPGPNSLVAGSTHLGGMITRYLVDRVALTAGLCWAGLIRRRSAGSEVVDVLPGQPGVAAIVHAHWLVNERHLVQWTNYLRFDLEAGQLDRPLSTLLLVRAWEPFQTALGLSVGQFDVRPLSTSASTSGARTQSLPVYPYVDFYFDF